MAIELTTADSSTINSIRETLSAAETSRLEAPKTDSREIYNGGGTLVTFLTADGAGNPEGTFGKVTVTFPLTDGLYERQLLRRLYRKFDGDDDFPYNYSNITLAINSLEGEIVSNVVGIYWPSQEVYEIFVDQPPNVDPYTVDFVRFNYDFVNTVGLDVPNNIYGMATDDNDIDIISGRDIDLRAADDIYIAAGSNFVLEHDRLDGQNEEEGIELITNNANNQYTWTFDFLGNTNLPGDLIFKNNNNVATSGSIMSYPLSSGDGNGYTTMELHPDNSRSEYDQYLIIDPTAPNHIHIRAGGQQDNSGAELILGGESSNVRIGYGENPSVNVSANNKNWEFGVNGFMYFPDGGILKIRGSAPGTSIGTEGDEAGMIAFDNDYFYYCTSEWNGSDNIWKRVQFSASTW